MVEGVAGPGRVRGGSFKSPSKKRWTIAALAATVLLVSTALTRSPVAGALLLVLLAAFAGICYLAARSLGINRDHPLVRSAATRPWRAGSDVFRLATGCLSDVFLITPKGSLLAPNSVEIRMNPADIDSLTEVIDLDLANELALEAYEVAINEKSAKMLNGEVAAVQVVADAQVPGGRYVVRQRIRLSAGHLAARAGIRSNISRRDLESGRTKISDEATMAEYDSNPILQLITGESVTQTRVSGARAGRGQAAEMLLPDRPTVSRIHARFTCTDGQWEITCLGRNGLLVNGSRLKGTQPIYHGDLIRWGQQAEAPTSRVEII